MLFWFSIADFSSLYASGIVKGRVYDASAPNIGLPSIEVGIETPDGKVTTLLTNSDGDYIAKVDVQIGSSITALYQSADYGVSVNVFVLDKEVIEKNAYLFKKRADDTSYWTKAVNNALSNKDILSSIGSVSGLWKSADRLGISTVGKIYLSRALTEKDPQIKGFNPDIIMFKDADPEAAKSFAALVQSMLDQDNRLPTKTQIVSVAPETKSLPTEVIADIFGTKLVEKPQLKQMEISQLGITWDPVVKKQTIDSVALKEAVFRMKGE